MPPPPQKTITILGSLNTDLTTLTTRLPRAGETLTALSFSTAPGGKGANQAVACARLSSSPTSFSPPSASSSPPSLPLSIAVKMFGAVGPDPFGHSLISALENDGVDTTGIKTLPASEKAVATGTAVIIVEQATGENRILVTPGANAFVTSGGVFDGDGGLPDLLVLQLETPVPVVVEAIVEARRGGGACAIESGARGGAPNQNLRRFGAP
ncbi:MAG: hypothetical protein Q9170_006041, partial [Blastenia crenularia]